MKHVSIKPQWTILMSDGRALPARVIDLLTRVRKHGSLLAACDEAGTSYRHAWDLIHQGETLFGTGLVERERGRGSRLTALGEKLVWADQRIAARLAPSFASLASELEAEIERVLMDRTDRLRVHASHGFAIEALLDRLARDGIAVDRKFCSSLEAPAALRDGACDLAGFHIPLGPHQAPALRHYARWLDPEHQSVIDLAARRQGLMVAPGNPLGIRTPHDLLRPDVRFINRQRNSGTRFLLEGLLTEAGVDPDDIAGFEQGEFTHAAVAAYVASGMADAGFGLEAAARRFKLDFVPLADERYFLLCDTTLVDTPLMRRLLAVVRSAAFRQEIDTLPGYDGSHAGRVERLCEAFAVPTMADGAR